MEETYYSKHKEEIKQKRQAKKEELKVKYKEWYETNKHDLYLRRKERLALKPKPVKIKKVKEKPLPPPPVFIPPPPVVSNTIYIEHDVVVSFT